MDPLAPLQRPLGSDPVERRDDPPTAPSSGRDAPDSEPVSQTDDVAVDPGAPYLAPGHDYDDAADLWIGNPSYDPTKAGVEAAIDGLDFYPEDISVAALPEGLLSLPPQTDVPDAAEYRIRVDAAQLADGFCAGVLSRRAAAAERLRSILRDFPHAASRGAIERLASAGVDLSTLEEIAGIKRFWRNDSGLWVLRRSSGAIAQSERLCHAMSWRLDWRLYGAWSGQTCAMLEDDLLARWLALPRRRDDRFDHRPVTYFSFTAWLDAQAKTIVGQSGMHGAPGLSAWDWMTQDDEDDVAKLRYRTEDGTRPFATLDASFWKGRALGPTVPIPASKAKPKETGP